MKAQLTTLPVTATPEAVAEILRRDGGVIIRDIVDSATLEGLRADLDPILEVTPPGIDPDFAGTATRRAGRLFARSPHIQTLALSPLYLGVSQLILQKPATYWLGEKRLDVVPDLRIGVTMAIRIYPGQGAQPLHRDDFVFLWEHPTYGREARVQIMLAVSDFTQANGATLVIPGSHRWDDQRAPRREEAVSAEMKAGSALIWVGSIYHAGGQNTCDAPRTGITLSYDLANLRQEENQLLSVPLETVREMPEQMQRLLGWTMGDNFMGYVERDGRAMDPRQLLDLPEYRMGEGILDSRNTQ
ncbi:phytanoyl-CoA dioxygenase family protein [Pseudomonas sp. dw_358]|uniref:phytanoyl-CoA dioxygenase family protein n=1 Tax=Pseudomonas sp. dw_358 TaxID=2720083 RepID=UPI001BD48C71|nr:phytanoyl-CoA dioxygenase family protein [Pseudomonas sp. dw_358]